MKSKAFWILGLIGTLPFITTAAFATRNGQQESQSITQLCHVTEKLPPLGHSGENIVQSESAVELMSGDTNTSKPSFLDPNLRLSLTASLKALAKERFKLYCHELARLLVENKVPFSKTVEVTEKVFESSPVFHELKNSRLKIVGPKIRLVSSQLLLKTEEDETIQSIVDDVVRENAPLSETLPITFLIYPFEKIPNNVFMTRRIESMGDSDPLIHFYTGCAPYLGLTQKDLIRMGFPKEDVKKHYLPILAHLFSKAKSSHRELYQGVASAINSHSEPSSVAFFTAEKNGFVLHDEHTSQFHKLIYNEQDQPQPMFLETMEKNGIHHVFFEGLFHDGVYKFGPEKNRSQVRYYGLETSQKALEAKAIAGFWVLVGNRHDPKDFGEILSSQWDVLLNAYPSKSKSIESLKRLYEKSGRARSKYSEKIDFTQFLHELAKFMNSSLLFSDHRKRFSEEFQSANRVRRVPQKWITQLDVSAEQNRQYWYRERDLHMKQKVVEIMEKSRDKNYASVVGSTHQSIMSEVYNNHDTQIDPGQHNYDHVYSEKGGHADPQKDFYDWLFPGVESVFDPRDGVVTEKTKRRVVHEHSQENLSDIERLMNRPHQLQEDVLLKNEELF